MTKCLSFLLTTALLLSPLQVFAAQEKWLWSSVDGECVCSIVDYTPREKLGDEIPSWSNPFLGLQKNEASGKHFLVAKEKQGAQNHIFRYEITAGQPIVTDIDEPLFPTTITFYVRNGNNKYSMFLATDKAQMSDDEQKARKKKATGLFEQIKAVRKALQDNTNLTFTPKPPSPKLDSVVNSNPSSQTNNRLPTASGVEIQVPSESNPGDGNTNDFGDKNGQKINTNNDENASKNFFQNHPKSSIGIAFVAVVAVAGIISTIVYTDAFSNRNTMPRRRT